MNFLKTKMFLTSLLALVFISGCGNTFKNSDLFQKNVVTKKIDTDRFDAKCELNVDEFSLIMEEDISPAIDCLGKNLTIFISAVQSKKPGYLSRTALASYIVQNRRDIKPEAVKALKSVFDLNFLVYGEDPDYISEENVKALVKFAKIFNTIASQNFKKAFKDKTQISFEAYTKVRDLGIKPAAQVVSSALREIFKPDRKGETHELDLLKLIDSFTTENNEEEMAKVKKLLFAKKILLGGDKTTITHKELSVLIDNFSSYVHLALDAVRFQNKSINLVQKTTIQLLNADLDLLNNLIFNNSMNRDEERFLTLNEGIDAVELFLSEDSNLKLYDYYDLLKEAKLVLMEGDPKTPEVITGADMRRLFSHGKNLLQTGILFHRFWAIENKVLERRPGKPIAYDFTNIRDNYSESEGPRMNDFIRIVKNYRFMKGENLSAYYTDEYMRNADAVFEIAIYEYVLKLVMKQFGCPNNTLNNKVVCDTKVTAEHKHMLTHPEIPGSQDGYVYMVKDQVVDLFKKFRKILIDQDMILPGREVKTAETITLLGSLFQYQSDENKVFDVNEATEFAISLFTSINIADDLNAHFVELNKQNKCDMDDFGRISPDCFNKNFFRGVCENYGSQYPKLFDSLGTPRDPVTKKVLCDQIPDLEENTAYLDKAVKAARSCHEYKQGSNEIIYYSKGDIMSIFLAMMHIETTIIRWDVSNFEKPNNIMDPSEVMAAYAIYSPALDSFLETMPPMIQKLKKQIYQYLIKYERVPDPKEFKSILKFAKFIFSFKKEASANRKTIASILFAIGEQGTPSYFDCSLLRDPTTLPDDYNPTGEEPVKSVTVPKSLTHDDAVLASEIDGESDSWIKTFFKKTIPDLFSFI